MIKKWNNFNILNESQEVDSMLVLDNNIILEKEASNSDWKEYANSSEFEKETGTSLNNEYKGNKSSELLSLFNSFKTKLKIKEAYFEGEPSSLLKIALKK